jgi:hypothetical protein
MSTCPEGERRRRWSCRVGWEAAFQISRVPDEGVLGKIVKLNPISIRWRPDDRLPVDGLSADGKELLNIHFREAFPEDRGEGGQGVVLPLESEEVENLAAEIGGEDAEYSVDGEDRLEGSNVEPEMREVRRLSDCFNRLPPHPTSVEEVFYRRRGTLAAEGAVEAMHESTKHTRIGNLRAAHPEEVESVEMNIPQDYDRDGLPGWGAGEEGGEDGAEMIDLRLQRRHVRSSEFEGKNAESGNEIVLPEEPVDGRMDDFPICFTRLEAVDHDDDQWVNDVLVDGEDGSRTRKELRFLLDLRAEIDDEGTSLM